MESVTNIIMDVVNEVCDKLCKYPSEYKKSTGIRMRVWTSLLKRSAKNVRLTS